MKKLIFFAAAAALMMTSCVKEQFGGAEGDRATVSFGLDIDNGVQTRADEKTSADELWYAVFDENDKLIEQFPATSQGVESYPTTVDITLTKGQTYTVAFWAQNSKCEAYTVNPDMNVEVSYDGLNNDVTRDAFFGSKTFTVKENGNDLEVTLVRPFAQFNVGATEQDITAAAKTGIVIKNSAVTVTGIPSKFDVFTGVATDPVDVSYDLAPIPGGTITVNEVPYTYLSVAYLLIEDKTTSTVTMTFDPEDEGKSDIVITQGLSNIPFQRNWRTNIVGTFLTGNVHFDVKLDEDFDNDYNIDYDNPVDENTPVETFEDLLEKGGVVTVEGAREEIDFNGLAVADDLMVILNAPVTEVKLGGNVAATKADSELPNITIYVGKNVAYPNFTFNGKAENYTIKGDLETNSPLTTKITTAGTVKNFTVEDVKATGNAMIDANNGTTGLIVKNCVATDLNAAFVDIFEIRDAKILDNTIALAASAQPEGDARHAITVYNCGDNILIEGNTITKTYKHGIFAQGVGTSALTIKDNKISGVVEDGIKIDRSHKVVVTGNVIDAADYGIRVDRLMPELGTADITINDNTISIDGIDVDGADATAIRVRYRSNEYPGGVTVNLTAKGNKAGANGIPEGKYVNFVSDGMTLTGDYAVPFDYADGVGMADDNSYAIYNANGLKWFAENVPSKIFFGKTIRLTEDIDLAGIDWTPITTGYYNMNGSTFDGNGKKIINMTVNKEGSEAAFIGYAGASMTIKNLTFVNPSVTSTSSFVGTVLGKHQYGTITLDNVDVVDGNVSSTNAKGIRIGGLVGFTVVHEQDPSLILKDCDVTGTTITGYHNLGGLVGTVITPVGNNICTMTNCSSKNNTFYYNRTAEDANNPEAWHPFDGDGYAAGKATKTNCVAENNKGIAPNGLVDYKNMEQKVYEYELSKAEHLFWFAEKANADKGQMFKNTTVSLGENIDLAGNNWVPVNMWNASNFVFDGKGYAIENMSAINDVSYGNGFFSNLVGKPTIKNLTFDNACVQRYSDTGSYSGNVYGIVSGYVYGTANFENVHVVNSYVEGYGKVAALVGMAADTGGVTTMKNCSVKNTKVAGVYNVAGLIGLVQNDMVMEDCVSDAEWAVSTNNEYVELDTTATYTENGVEKVVDVKGTYWKYSEWYYAGWSKFYNDAYYGDALLASGGNLADGLCHN